MKNHKTNYWGLLVIAVIGSILALFFISKNDVQSIRSVNIFGIINQNKSDDKFAKEVLSVGNIKLSYPVNLVDVRTEENRIVFLFKKLNFLVNNKEKYIPAYFYLTYSKNANKDELPLQTWLDEEDIEYPPQAPIPYNEENFNKGPIEFHKHSVIGLNPQGYELNELSFASGKDIYIVEYFSIPQNPNLQRKNFFSENDIFQAKQYEKIVDQILSSIHFIN